MMDFTEEDLAELQKLFEEIHARDFPLATKAGFLNKIRGKYRKSSTNAVFAGFKMYAKYIREKSKDDKKCD